MGKVALIGAGPGDPGLITVRGLALLKDADVVVHDRLIAEELLGHVRADALVINAGKRRGGHLLTQDAINALLVEHGAAGKLVARLKGGDPFVFGRGGEEAMALAAAGVPFEVVPGVTSAIAAAAYAGIPVTQRRMASSLAVVTGSEDPARAESGVDWAAMARADTVVALMGVETLPAITEALMAAGRAADTPACVVEWGTTPRQRVVEGTLVTIGAAAHEAQVEAPAALIVGEVAALRAQIRWYDNAPLFGKRVLVTRARRQASALSAQVAARGGVPVELPVIALQPLDSADTLGRAIAQLAAYRWVVFTSANGVAGFFAALDARGLDARALGAVQAAAIGPGTANALQEHGVRADYVPESYVAEALAAGLAPRLRPGDRVLLPRAEGGRTLLVEALQAADAQVDEALLYRAAADEDALTRARAVFSEGIDVVTLASSSAARRLVEALEGDAAAVNRCAVACIGPVTAQTARELGLRVDVVAGEHTIPGLVAAMEAWFAGRAAAPVGA